MDRLESMTTFVAAATAGSLSAAARRLGTPLATVSRRVADLEAHLQTRLFNRSSRQLALTEAGRSYLIACQQILDQVDHAERQVTGEYRAPRGELVLTAPIVFGRLHLLPIVTEFLTAYPEVDVRMRLTDHVTNLFEESVDVALRIGLLPDSSLVAVRIGAIHQVVCASPSYLANRGTPEQPGDLKDHCCVAFEGLSSAHAWTFNDQQGATSVPVHSRLVVNTAEAAIDAAAAGLGLTRVLSYQVASAERAGTLVRVLRAFEPSPSPVHLVYPGQPLLALKLRAFIDFAVPRLKARIE